MEKLTTLQLCRKLEDDYGYQIFDKIEICKEFDNFYSVDLDEETLQTLYNVYVDYDMCFNSIYEYVKTIAEYYEREDIGDNEVVEKINSGSFIEELPKIAQDCFLY